MLKDVSKIIIDFFEDKKLNYKNTYRIIIYYISKNV